MRSAGFAQRETKVRRCGDQSDYHSDGSCKPSSYLSRSDDPTLAWSTRHDAHPSLLLPANLHKDNRTRRDAVPAGNHRVIATVGYRGYIPGKDAETVFGALTTAVNQECWKRREGQAGGDISGVYKCEVMLEEQKRTGKVDLGYNMQDRIPPSFASRKTVPRHTRQTDFTKLEGITGYAGYKPMG